MNAHSLGWMAVCLHDIGFSIPSRINNLLKLHTGFFPDEKLVLALQQIIRERPQRLRPLA